jgi:hypothetical protein
MAAYRAIIRQAAVRRRKAHARVRLAKLAQYRIESNCMFDAAT